MDEPKKRKNKRLNCAKANIKGTKHYLKDKDWQKLLKLKSVQYVINKFTARFFEAVDKFLLVTIIG